MYNNTTLQNFSHTLTTFKHANGVWGKITFCSKMTHLAQKIKQGKKSF